MKIKVLQTFVTLVSKSVDLRDGERGRYRGYKASLVFSADDIPKHPKDSWLVIRGANFAPSAGIFCTKAVYGDKALVSPDSVPPLSFLSQQWDTITIRPGECLEMEFLSGEARCLTATFAVKRMQELP